MRETLGREFIRALNDFEKKADIEIRMSGVTKSHPAIVVDRTDDNILIESPRTIHMSHRKLVWLDEKLNAAGKYSWLILEKYVRIIINNPYLKQINQLTPEQSKNFMYELFQRMLSIVDDGDYDTDNISTIFQAMHNAFGTEENLINMIIEIIGDILANVPTHTNICRTCKYCTTLGETPGYGRCAICTFTPTEEDNVTLSEFRSEYGKHIYSKNGVIYTDITTGCVSCDDYLQRPINISGVLRTWLTQ